LYGVYCPIVELFSAPGLKVPAADSGLFESCCASTRAIASLSTTLSIRISISTVLTGVLKSIFKELSGSERREAAATSITTEGVKVKLPRLLLSGALAFHRLQGYSNAKWLIGKSAATSPIPKSAGPRHPQIRLMLGGRRWLVS